MSFFMGFATGLAKSVDTQLKESIERTRDNIDMVSKWRLKKAEEREKERRSKDKEIEKMIKDAAYVISGSANDVEAQNMAAALYKERGLTGFTDDINFMREQKNDRGVVPKTYITRAGEDLGNKYTLSEIVRSLSDAESSYAPSDMIFPKGTIRGSGLIGAIAPGFDVTAAGEERATQQMQQIGLATTPVAPSLSFERYVFDRQEFRYHAMDTNEKLTFLNDRLQDPSTDPDEIPELQTKLKNLTNTSIELGDDTAALSAIEMQISRMEPLNADGTENTEYSDLVKRRRAINDKIKLREAADVGQHEVFAYQSVMASRDGDPIKALELAHKAAELDPTAKKGPAAKAARKLELINAKLDGPNGDVYKDSQEYKTAMEEVRQLQTFALNQAGYTDVDLNRQRNTVFNNAKQKLSLANPTLGLVIGKLGETLTADEYVKFAMTLKKNKTDASVFKQYVNEAVNEARLLAQKNGWNTDMYDDIAIQLDAKIDDSFKLAESRGSVGTGVATGGQAGGAEGAGPGAGAGTGAGQDGTGAAPAASTTLSSEELEKLKGGKPEDDGFDEAGVQHRLAGYANVTNDEILDMQAKYSLDDPLGFVRYMKGSGDDNNKVIGDARGIYPDNPEFAEAVTKLLSEESANVAAQSLKDVGYVDNTIMTEDQRIGAISIVTDTLGVPRDQAEYLIDRAQNRGVVGTELVDRAAAKNIRDALDRQNLTGFSGLTVPDARMPQAIDFISKRFNISETEAKRLIDLAFTAEDDGIDAFDIETISPGGTMSMDEMRGDGTDTDFAKSFRENTLIGQIFDGENRDTSKSAPSSFSVEEAAAEQFRNRDDLPTGKEFPGAPKAKVEEGEQDNREERGLMVPSKRTSPENRMRGASNAALIAAYISEDMSDLERKEIRRRLETDKSFVDQLAAVLDRVNKKKKGQDSKLTEEQLKALRSRTSKQQVPMARGGLMRR